MKTLNLIFSLLLLGGSCETALGSDVTAGTSATIPATNNPPIAAPAKTPPTWYVFRIKALYKVTHSDDGTSAVVEGLTIKDKKFTVKLVWDNFFKNTHPKALDRWLNLPKAEFDAGVPYVIAGKVISRDPLTIKPDTVVSHAPNFGAPAENVY